MGLKNVDKTKAMCASYIMEMSGLPTLYVDGKGIDFCHKNGDAQTILESCNLAPVVNTMTAMVTHVQHTKEGTLLQKAYRAETKGSRA